MKSLIRLNEYTRHEIEHIFQIADELCDEKLKEKYQGYLKNKTVIMFFPENSIRTRVTFEKGIHLLGGQTILFSPETLDKSEEIEDVIGYLNNWADIVVARHKNIQLLDQIKKYARVPLINAMTSSNHPCEILSDIYALSKIRNNWKDDKFVFVGGKGNIGLAWKEAQEVLGIDIIQSCPKGYEIEGMKVEYDLSKAVIDRDIICTDSFPSDGIKAFKNYQVTRKIMDQTNKGAILNPCPPFYRGEEVDKKVIDSKYFVGYGFKKHLLEIQQAILIFSMR